MRSMVDFCKFATASYKLKGESCKIISIEDNPTAFYMTLIAASLDNSPPDKGWSIDEQSYTSQSKTQSWGNQRSLHSETDPFSTKNTCSTIGQENNHNHRLSKFA